MAPKTNSGFDIDLESFQAAADNFKSIIALFTEAGLDKLISTRCKLLETELTELIAHVQITEQGEISGTIYETPVSISAEHIRTTFDLPSGDESIELTPDEIKHLLTTMKFSKDRPIHLKKIDFSDEYRLLADIVGKVLLCKISAHDAVPKHQLNIMGVLVLKKKVDWASWLLKIIGSRYSHKENAYMRIMSQVLFHSFPDLCRSKGIPIPPGKRMSIALFSKWTRQIPKPGSIPERTPTPPNSPAHPSPPPSPQRDNSSLPPSSTQIASTTLTTPTLPTSSQTPAQTAVSPSLPPPILPSSLPPLSPIPHVSTHFSPPPSPLPPSSPPHLSHHESSASTEALLTQCIKSAAEKFQVMLDEHCSQIHSSILHMHTQIDGVSASMQGLKTSLSSSRVTRSFLTSLAKKVKKGENLDEEQLSNPKSLSHKSPPPKSDKILGNETVPELHNDEQTIEVLNIARDAANQMALLQGEGSRAENEAAKEDGEKDKETELQGELEAVFINEAETQGEQMAETQGELGELPTNEKEKLSSPKTVVFKRKRKTPPTPPE